MRRLGASGVVSGDVVGSSGKLLFESGEMSMKRQLQRSKAGIGCRRCIRNEFLSDLGQVGLKIGNLVHCGTKGIEVGLHSLTNCHKVGCHGFDMLVQACNLSGFSL
jgi:hypothetical protein